MAPWGRGRLGSRLVLAFVGVALAAEAASASVTLLTSRSDLAALASTQRADQRRPSCRPSTTPTGPRTGGPGPISVPP